MPVINEYNITKLYTTVVLSLFDSIQINRRAEPYTIPVIFGNKSELYKRLFSEATKDPSVTYQLQVPAMSLDYLGFERNLDRQTNRLLKRNILTIDSQTAMVNWNDVAVDFHFKLTLISKSMTEMSNINEYIMSVFKNGLYYVDVKTPLYTDVISTPVVMKTADVSIENNEDVYEQPRALETTFDIVVKGLLHNNISSSNPVITKAMLNIYMDLQFKTLIESYSIPKV
jgi:hypothetical protein